PIDLVEACLARIRGLDDRLTAWSFVDADGARATARERQREARAGRLRGPLHGVPIGVKDIFDVAGMPTTGGARPFAHTRPAVDSTAVARLRAAGAIIVGKTVTTEFAYRDPARARHAGARGTHRKRGRRPLACRRDRVEGRAAAVLRRDPRRGTDRARSRGRGVS